MTARRQWTIVLGVAVLLLVGVWTATRLLGSELVSVAPGSTAPSFTASVVQTAPARGTPPGTAAVPGTGTRSLADYRGQVVLVNIWATWCGPCREEIPSLQALYREFAPRGFKVVAVSVDDAADARSKVASFVKQYGVTFDVLLDSTGTIQNTYQSTGVPENFVLGTDGVIRKKTYAQDWNSPENRALISRLLDEQRQAR